MTKQKLREILLNPVFGSFRRYLTLGTLVGTSITGCSGSSNTGGKADAVIYDTSEWGGGFSPTNNYTPDTSSSLKETKSGNQPCFKDNDSDGIGSSNSGWGMFDECIDGWSSKNGDCDDNDSNIWENCPKNDADASGSPDTFNNKYVVEIAAGGNHACAHLSTNEVYCWGFNHRGQLGNGTNLDSYSPTKVIGLGEIVVKQLAAGYNHTCARSDGGEVICWGDYKADDTNHSTPEKLQGELEGLFVTQIVAGDAHTLAVVGNLTLYTWGSGGHGNLCIDEETDKGTGQWLDHYIPVKAATFEDTGESIKQVAAGAGISFILLNSGKALGCGRDSSGLLGDGDGNVSSTNIPTPVKGMDGKDPIGKIVQIAAGYGHAVALAESGTVYFWGDNTKYQSGLGKGSENFYTAPVPLNDLGGIVSHLSCGDMHTCAAFSDGRIKCYGSNPNGQLAQDPTIIHEVYSAQDAPFFYVKDNLNVIQIDAGRMFNGAVTKNGTALFWGKNEYGPLGDGGTQDHWEPTEVEFD